MIPFAAYTEEETPNVFQWAVQPPKKNPFDLDLINQSINQSSNSWFLGSNM